MRVEDYNDSAAYSYMNNTTAPIVDHSGDYGVPKKNMYMVEEAIRRH